MTLSSGTRATAAMSSRASGFDTLLVNGANVNQNIALIGRLPGG